MATNVFLNTGLTLESRVAESHGLLLDLITARIGAELSLKTYVDYPLKDWQLVQE